MRANLLVLVLILSAPLGSRLNAQDGAEQVEKWLELCRQLRNPASTSRLLVLRREEPFLVRPVILLGRQAKASESDVKLEPDAVEYLVQSFRDLSAQLFKKPSSSIDALDIAREKGSELADADRKLLDALDRSIHLKIADQAIARFEDSGAFDGMFSGLFVERPRVARAFMDHALDRLRSVSYRAYAFQGAAELARDEQRERFAEEARQILSQGDEEAYIKRCALILMKRCGRDAEFDAEFDRRELAVSAELAKPRGEQQVAVLLEHYESLIELCSGTRDRRTALAYDEAYCRLLLGQCHYETQPAEARVGIGRALYDFACRLSQVKAVEAASLVLDLALSWGYRDLAWLENDPELEHWRKADLGREQLVSFRKGNIEGGSISFEPARWDAIVGEAVRAAQVRQKPAKASENSKE